MSWCRFGRDSDLYVFEHVAGFWQCTCCPLDVAREHRMEATELGMARHVLDHVEAGHRVPPALRQACEEALDER